MKNHSRVVLILTMWGMISAVQAETVYVAERVRIGLRAEAVETSAVVKTIETGVALELVERFDRFAHVRDPQGTEGWIEARFLTPDPPAHLQLTKLQDELTKSRGQTTEVQTQLKKAQTVAAEQELKIKALEKEIADKSALPPPADPAPAAPVPAPPAGKISKDRVFNMGYLWLVISFAMLGIGFAAGVKWLRESIRKRSGGMYLRI